MYERHQVCSFVACAMHLWEDIDVINQGSCLPLWQSTDGLPSAAALDALDAWPWRSCVPVVMELPVC